MPTKQKGRGISFRKAEVLHLLEIIEEMLPLSATEWERVADLHSEMYPANERTGESLRRKYRLLAKKKIPTGDPACPEEVRRAKHIATMIVEKTEASSGDESEDEDEALAGDDDEVSDGVASGLEVDMEGGDEEGAGGGSGLPPELAVPVATTEDPLFNEDASGGLSIPSDEDGGGKLPADSRPVERQQRKRGSDGVTNSSGKGRKKSRHSSHAIAASSVAASAATARGAANHSARKPRAFATPISRGRDKKKKGRYEDDSDDDISASHIMSMMMMQSRADAAARDREIELRREEMASQRQFMQCMMTMMMQNANPTRPVGMAPFGMGMAGQGYAAGSGQSFQNNGNAAVPNLNRNMHAAEESDGAEEDDGNK